MTHATSTPTTPDVIRLFLRDRGASAEFAAALADRAVAQLPGPIDGRLVLDLGCGPGTYSAAMERGGATVVSTDLHVDELRRYGAGPVRAVVSDGRRTPFADASFAAVLCSNVLEHTPQPFQVLEEIERVLVPGGWAYISWTNWLSPWGGHAVAPLHYIGAARSLRWWHRLFGEPKGVNRPLDGVWPTYIGTTLDWLRHRAGLRIDAVYPRYWPSLRVLMRVPGLREVAAWNCVIHVTRLPDEVH